MHSKNVLLFGREESLPERIELRAGPLTMLYENGDLRYIKFHDREVIRRIYVAIRDRNWGTVSPNFTDIQMDIGTDAFRIAYDVENKQGEIDFTWRGEITGNPDGTLHFSMDGVAQSTFWRNRIGFCILHPAFLAGARCIVEHVDGSREDAHLPTTISAAQPVHPFGEMTGMAHEVLPGVWAEARYSGDSFEVEDQRNWTDASFKTFCTPLRLAYPVEVQEGSRISQAVTLAIRDKRDRADVAEAVATPLVLALAPLTFSIGPRSEALPLPTIGLGTASHGQPLTGKERSRLAALHLSHLRVDLHLDEPGFQDTLERSWSEAKSLGIPLETALLVPVEADEPLEALRRLLDQLQPDILRWLVFPAKEVFLGGSPVTEVVGLAHTHLDSYRPGIQFCSGTNTDFIFLQRNMPPLNEVDALTFAITAEAHATDEASVMETLEAQPMVVQTARQLASDKPVIVSPITFKMRHNPYATGPWPVIRPGELPPMVEERQMSLFGAAWTLGSLKSLSESGAHSLTYFETSGWRGVMETEQGSPLPAKFRSMPGSVFPMYHVFESTGEFAGGKVIPTRTSDHLRVQGIALQKGSRMRIMVANLTAEPQVVQICNLGPRVSLLSLDETNVVEAMQSPEEFRSRSGEPVQASDGNLEINLLPYAVVRIDE